jgi:ribosomal protein S18 acetylase RimI-like enzyme
MTDFMERSSKCRDMLVRLYELPEVNPFIEKLKVDGITIRKALVPEKHMVVNWVRDQFGHGWASECEAAFSNHPMSCFIATKDNKVMGFSVYDATARGVAGPLGIDPHFRGKSLGTALFIHMLKDMHYKGYAYAVIGWVAPGTQGFFEKAVVADVIERSVPTSGMYRGILVE